MPPPEIKELTELAHRLQQQTRAEACSIFLKHPGHSAHVQLVACWSELRESQKEEVLLPIRSSYDNPSLTGHIADVFQQNHTFTPNTQPGFDGVFQLDQNDLQRYPFHAGKSLPNLKERVWSILAVPILEKNGRFLGLIALNNRNDDSRTPYSQEERQIALDFAREAGRLIPLLPGYRPFDVLMELARIAGEFQVLGGGPAKRPAAYAREFLERASALIAADLAVITVRRDLLGIRTQRLGRGPAGTFVRLARAGRRDLIPADKDNESMVSQLLRNAEAGVAFQDDSQRWLAVPISDGGEHLGAMAFQTLRGEPFQAHEGADIQRVASLFAAALRTFHSARQVDRTLRKSWMLRRVTSGVLDTFLRTAKDTLGYRKSVVFLPDFAFHTLRVVAQHGGTDSWLQLKISLGQEPQTMAAIAWREHRSVFDENPLLRAGSAPFLLRQLEITGPLWVVPVLAPWPVHSHEDRISLGLVAFWDRDPSLPAGENAAMRARLEQFVQLATSSLAARLAYLRTSEINLSMRNLLRSGRSDDVWHTVTTQLMRTLQSCGFQRVRLFRWDATTDSFLPEGQLGMDNPAEFMRQRITKATNPFAADTVRRATHPTPDDDDDVFTYWPGRNGAPDPDAPKLEKEPGQPWIVVPLVKNGKLIGQIAADAGRGARTLPTDSLEYLRLLTPIARNLLELEPAKTTSIPIDLLRPALDKLAGPVTNLVALMRPPFLPGLTDLARFELERMERMCARLEELIVLHAAPSTPAGKVSIWDQLEIVRGQLTPLLQRGEIHVEAPPPPTPAFCSVPAPLVQVILINLLENAIVFSPDGSTVRVSIRQDQDACLLEIDDQAPLVPEALRQTVFEEFVSLPRAATGRELPPLRHSMATSLGLGLYLVKQTVDRYGGTIECRPSGMGNCWICRLP